MIKDMTIGQYYEGNSPVHRLDPRTKLIITITYAILVFFCTTLPLVIWATVGLVVYVLMSRVPLRHIFRGLKFVWFFVIVTAVVSLFNGDGEVLWSWWKLSVTTGGLYRTGILTMRLFYLIVGSSIMTYTTMPLRLTDGLERIFSFLKVFRVPVSEMAMMISIALRFIPILMEELDKIIKAQTSRGADFESGNVFKRIKAYVPVLVPLFASSIRRATELAEAMDARCYQGGEGRTKLVPLEYTYRDVVAYGCLAVFAVGVILGRTVFM